MVCYEKRKQRPPLSVSHDRSAINFKVEALKVLQDRQKAKNGRLLNVLLYILALIGSFQTLEVLKTEFGISFGWGVIVVCAIFGLFGVI